MKYDPVFWKLGLMCFCTHSESTIRLLKVFGLRWGLTLCLRATSLLLWGWALQPGCRLGSRVSCLRALSAQWVTALIGSRSSGMPGKSRQDLWHRCHTIWLVSCTWSDWFLNVSTQMKGFGDHLAQQIISVELTSRCFLFKILQIWFLLFSVLPRRNMYKASVICRYKNELTEDVVKAAHTLKALGCLSLIELRWMNVELQVCEFLFILRT